MSILVLALLSVVLAVVQSRLGILGRGDPKEVGDYDFGAPEGSPLTLRRSAHLRQERIERHCRAIALDLLRPASMKTRQGANFGVWWQDYYEPSWACPLEERVQLRNPIEIKKFGASYGDGGKWLCDPQDTLARLKRPCLIYSFGSNGEFSFELGVASLMQSRSQDRSNSCEIHVFDPFNMEQEGSTSAEQNATREALIRSNVHLHRIGIAPYDYDTPKLDKWKGIQVKMRSLESIAKMLGHSGGTIDVLKIDVDGGEYGMFDNSTWWDSLQASGLKIGQLLLEVHFNAISPVTFRFRDERGAWVRARTGEEVDGILRTILQKGFAMFHKEINLIGRPPNDAAEFAFVKLNIQCPNSSNLAIQDH